MVSKFELSPTCEVECVVEVRLEITENAVDHACRRSHLAPGPSLYRSKLRVLVLALD